MKLGKRWNFQKEDEILRIWENEEFPWRENAETIIIDTPPVYPSGTWHVGAVAGYSLIDMIVRYERMNGKNVIFPFCLDRNGINIEQVIEKRYNKKLHEWDREKFIEKCREEIDKYSKEIKYIAHRVGLSADYKNTYYETDSPEYRKFTQATFIELWKKGYIYEDFRPNFYCPGCRTTIAEAEIEYVEKETDLVYLKFEVVGEKEPLIVATTRPELLAACRAVLVHPDDERYTHLHNKEAIVPLYKHRVKIIPHPYAKKEFGSGAVMICSYGDLADIRLFRELRLEPVAMIDETGRMREPAGKYAGMPVKKARMAIIEDLKKMGYVVKIEKTMHRTPTCSRSKDVIEFVSTKELYLKQVELKEELKKIADKMDFRPTDKYKQVLFDWIDGITIDWPLTRRRYYHTEVPLWHCLDCGEVIVPEPGKYYQPWKQPPPVKKCPKCGSTNIRGDPRVFDTWMDSSITNLYMAKYLRDDKFFKKHFPVAMVRPQGRDIIRTWLYYTTLKSYIHTRQPPFHWVFIHGMGLDPHGRKMSKSRGNIIPPMDLIDKYGADAFRMWAAIEAGTCDDFRVDPARVDAARKFLTKLWNIVRFATILGENTGINLADAVPNGQFNDIIEEITSVVPEEKMWASDKWIIAALNELLCEIQPMLEKWGFSKPVARIRDFIKNEFASHYLEMIKERAYSGNKDVVRILVTIISILLRLLAPFIPFITDYIYRKLFGRSVHLEYYPKPRKSWNKELVELGKELMEFNSYVWKVKKEKGLSLRESISEIEIPEKLKLFEKELIALHHIQ